MELKRSAYRGCLLGMAVGDAMGYSVDGKSWAQIQEDYGPNGLMGYDLVNGYAEITSNTQLAAYSCNGLLIALTRGQMVGKMAPPVKYVGLSSREWVASQRPWGRPEKTFCWLLRQSAMNRRHCLDTRIMDTLSRKELGTMDAPINSFSGPAALTGAVAAGLFMGQGRMEQEEIDLLGGEIVALSHGSPAAFLSGVALAHMVSRCLYHPEVSMTLVVNETCQLLKNKFGHRYSQCYEVTNNLQMALSLAADPRMSPVEALERLRCGNAPEVLAGAVYTVITGGLNFDTAMITAVNHSGRSAAVGAVAGALLGLRLGEEALPGFYVECLEPAEILSELADDMYEGCPMEMGSKLFDLDWDRKYIHGGHE